MNRLQPSCFILQFECCGDEVFRTWEPAAKCEFIFAQALSSADKLTGLGADSNDLALFDE
jgi:hypothetical protein